MERIYEQWSRPVFTGGKMIIRLVINERPQAFGTKQSRAFHHGPVAKEFSLLCGGKKEQGCPVFFLAVPPGAQPGGREVRVYPVSPSKEGIVLFPDSIKDRLIPAGFNADGWGAQCSG
jgi:hypothetical protein